MKAGHYLIQWQNAEALGSSDLLDEELFATTKPLDSIRHPIKIADSRTVVAICDIEPQPDGSLIFRYGGKHASENAANEIFIGDMRIEPEKLHSATELEWKSEGKAAFERLPVIVDYWPKIGASPDLRRNPTWNRDELILALDLYMTNPANPPGKGSKAVAELSDLLNKLHMLNGAAATGTLRNANGVYLKMMNLRSLDPQFTAQGKVGMTAGGKLEKVVWAEYDGRRAVLASDASSIRQAILSAKGLPGGAPEDDYEGTEGGIVLRLHRLRERDTKLIARKKQQAKAAGKLACEVCNFDFSDRYGALGVDYIEVHHVNAVALMVSGAKTKLSDLVLLCSNCHRMAHRRRIPLTISEIKQALRP